MRRIALSAVVVALLGLGAYGVLDRSAPQPSMAQAQDSQTETTSTTTESTTVGVQPLDENAALLEDEENTISVIDTFGKSVVSINIYLRGEVVDPFANLQLPPGFELPPDFQQPEAPQGSEDELRQQGTGSGFVVDEQGYIATNFHVIESALQENSIEPNADAEVRVVFSGSDKEYTATIVGANALYDLALLQLTNPDDLPENAQPFTLADSDQLRAGQKTIAIGNPFGLESTVTTGIVSATNRRTPFPSIGGINVPMVQTDAAINPGNSGGPLLNSRGEVIGINTAIIPSGNGITQERGSLGIGFAMPSNVLADNLEALRNGQYIGNLLSRPRIGLNIASSDDPQVFSDEQRQQLNIPEGVVVVRVSPGGPGADAGLQEALDDQNNVIPDQADIILSVDGTPVTTPEELQGVILGKGQGDVVTLNVWRNGEERTVEVTLEVVEEAQR
jgi:serine protease Do